MPVCGASNTHSWGEFCPGTTLCLGSEGQEWNPAGGLCPCGEHALYDGAQGLSCLGHCAQTLITGWMATGACIGACVLCSFDDFVGQGGARLPACALGQLAHDRGAWP